MIPISKLQTASTPPTTTNTCTPLVGLTCSFAVPSTLSFPLSIPHRCNSRISSQKVLASPQDFFVTYIIKTTYNAWYLEEGIVINFTPRTLPFLHDESDPANLFPYREVRDGNLHFSVPLFWHIINDCSIITNWCKVITTRLVI